MYEGQSVDILRIKILILGRKLARSESLALELDLAAKDDLVARTGCMYSVQYSIILRDTRTTFDHRTVFLRGRNETRKRSRAREKKVTSKLASAHQNHRLSSTFIIFL